MWSLVTLGSLRLIDARTGDGCLGGRRKELLLLAFLSRRAPRLVPRAVLAELLWGDRDEDRARASLRQALSQLRRTLGEALDVRPEGVALAADAVTVDVTHVEEAATSGRWHDVIARWTGPFLVGQDDQGGESYREWLDGERARLTRILERAFTVLTDDAEQRNAQNEMAALARQWHDALPDDDRAAEALTRALATLKLVQPSVQEPAKERVHETAPSPTHTIAPDRPAPASRRPWVAYTGALAATLILITTAARKSFEGVKPTPARAEQTVIVPDLRARGVDSVLAQTISEALRIALRESRVLAVFPSTAVEQARRTLGVPDGIPLDIETVRRIAARAGIKAVVNGEILGNGGTYLLSLTLVATSSGAEIGHYSGKAADSTELFSAVDDLTAQLRRGAGERLRDVEDARPVERVTTKSLSAFAKYVRATRAFDIEGLPAKGIALLEEAIALDSTFAMAYRRLALALNDRGENAARVRDLVTRAYDLRTPLGDGERYAVEAAYYQLGSTPSEEKAVAAYEAALESNPRFGLPLINLSTIALRRHQFARAESLTKRAIALATSTVAGHVNQMVAQVALGRLDDAEATLAHFDSVAPGSHRVAVERAQLLYARGQYDTATRVLREIFDHSTDVARRQWVAGVLRDIALAHNNVVDGRRWANVWTEGALQRGLPAAALAGALDQAWITLWFDHDSSAALREVATALRRHPLTAIPPLDRPYDKLIRVYAWGGRPAHARIALAGYDSAIGIPARPRARALGLRYRGEIELAEGKYKDAMASFRAADSTSCVTCLFPLLAITFERMGVRDSAGVFWRRYLETPEMDRFETDARFRQHALKERSPGG